MLEPRQFSLLKCKVLFKGRILSILFSTFLITCEFQSYTPYFITSLSLHSDNFTPEKDSTLTNHIWVMLYTDKATTITIITAECLFTETEQQSSK